MSQLAPGQTAPFTVAFITGAAQGIGREIALKLADDGFNVAINDIQSNAENLNSVAKEVTAKGRVALPLFGDVSQEDAVRSMVEKTVEVLGRLDVVRTPHCQRPSVQSVAILTSPSADGGQCGNCAYQRDRRS